MRSLVLIGSGWHPSLFRAEVSALSGPIEVLHPRAVFLTNDEDALHRLSGTALVDDALISTARLWDPSPLSVGELAGHIAQWAVTSLPEGSFAIRTRKLGRGIDDLSCSRIESEAGAQLSSDVNPVDLEEPTHEVVVILAGPEDGSTHWDDAVPTSPIVLWGIRDGNSKGGYTGTSPTERPFFKPVTLDPRLARLMVSLSHRRGHSPTVVVDPFCGTGGIAIEASLLGMEVLASDLDEGMVEGTRTNLEWAGGQLSHLVEQCAADRIHDLWGERPGCSFVFDPPYGRNAWASDDGLELLLGALSSSRKMNPEGSVCTMLPTSPDALEGPVSDQQAVMGRTWDEIKDLIRETGWQVALSSPLRVHRSLSRLVVVCHPAD
jgi:tRNA (guanine10-N2)-dimethyltransferase